ncbi:hypothetical protein FRB97_008214 [Tulasnella sp. 331]|nr:hypothetical protein FRB97_008214 [Tulasnella sp. 331]
MKPASGTTITLQPPFNLTFFLAGNEPYILPIGSPPASGTSYLYDWTVHLPTGGPYQIMLTDSNGAIGGPIAIDSVTEENPPTGCTSVTLNPPTLNLNFNTSDTAQCAEMPVQVTGGTPPYTFVVIEEWQLVKTIIYSTGNFYYTVDAQLGNKVICESPQSSLISPPSYRIEEPLTVAVTDSTGKSAVGDLFRVTPSSIVNCTTLASTVTPLSPAQTSIYQGLQTISVNGASPNPGKKSHAGAIAGGVIGGMVLLLLAALAGALWHRKRRKDASRHDRVDLFDPAEPVSEPAMGNSMVAPTPFPYTPTLPMSEAGFAGLGVPSQHKSAMVPAQHTRGSSFYETFLPTGESPPYTATDAGSSANPRDSNRFSGTSFAASDQDLMGIHSRVGSPVGQRVGSPPLPSGAAAPSTFASMRTPLPEEPEHDPLQSEFPPDRSHSPPPTY